MRNFHDEIEDYLYPERKAKRIQEQREREMAFWREKAKGLSDRELLEAIYVAVKTRIIL